MIIALLVLILLAIVFPGLVRGLIAVVVTLVFFVWLTGAADATGTFCAVPKETGDGFVAVRNGPSVSSRQLGYVVPNDFLYVGTEQCRSDFGRLQCSDDGKWVFVEAVVPFGNRKAPSGWLNGSLVRVIACP